jgi:predicted secreted protein
MADAVKAEGLVLAFEYGAGVYPFACAKNSSITISKEMIELAPKTDGKFREYLSGKRSFSISGSGLVKVAQDNMIPIAGFDSFMIGTDVALKGYLDIIDAQNNLRVYAFDCFIQELTYDSTVGGFANYSYSLQGSGPLSLLSEIDTRTVTSGEITARNPADYKLVAVGYDGKWFYNYSVTGTTPNFVISMGTSLNGKSVKAVYIEI